ncbi:hypothetical protein B4166_1657 [Caldibacillus thermoamylovorans]|nr:hypothetical protein B4166_1657 [Caldibacillus thermoamylovorans]
MVDKGFSESHLKILIFIRNRDCDSGLKIPNSSYILKMKP